MKIPNRTFWIQLGRLGAMLDSIDEHRRFLEAFRQSPAWLELDEEQQFRVTKLHQLLEDIASID